jgi:multicomponent Na+:H+ antiporter subunit G
MDQEYLNIIGGVIAIIGSIVLLISSLGLVRMPDAYNRIQVGTKASTMGTILSIASLFFIYPDWFGKLLILVLFVLITNPVSSHVIARAAYHIKVPFSSRTVVDQLKEKEKVDERSALHRKVRIQKEGE